jgi:REP element-mobilizing transposase RayT
MTLYKNKYRAESTRLADWDYSSAGYYFVTICTYNREILFGNISDNVMILSEYGNIVKEEWLKSTEIRKEIELDEFVIMPNHVHGIIIINHDDDVETNGRSSLQQKQFSMQPKSIPSFIAGFKSSATKRINIARNMKGNPVWQRNYYERIIRNEKELHQIRAYIHNNPLNWYKDELF